MAKWTQSHVGRHRCEQSGQVLYANLVSDTLWSGGGSSNAEIIQSHIFVPIAIVTLGPINIDRQSFLNILGEHLLDRLGESLSSVSGDRRKTTLLLQRPSVLM